VPKGPLGLYPLSAAIHPFIPVCEYCYMTDKYYISYYLIQDSYQTEEQIKDQVANDGLVTVQHIDTRSLPLGVIGCQRTHPRNTRPTCSCSLPKLCVAKVKLGNTGQNSVSGSNALHASPTASVLSRTSTHPASPFLS